MRMCAVLLLILGVAASADDPKKGAKDEQALEGLWQAVDLQANGQKAPAEEVKEIQIQIKGEQLVIGPSTRKHKLAIDPDAKPKTLDLTPYDGPAKGKKLSCAIYKLDGDKLVICLNEEGEGKKRPT